VDKISDFQGTQVSNDCQKIRQAKTFAELLHTITFSKLRDVFHELYNVRGLSMERIALELNKDYRTINNWIRILKISRRPNVAPFHLPKIVSCEQMEGAKLGVLNGKPVKLVSICPSDELRYFIGFAVGDGWIGSNMVEICNAEFGLFDLLLSMMNQLKARYGGKVGFQFREYKNKYSTTREKASSYRIWWSNSNIARLIKQDGRLRSDTLDFLLESKPELFLAGLWDAEGCISYFIGDRLYVNLILYQGERNIELINKVANTLCELGIKTSCRVAGKKYEPRRFYGKPCHANEDVYGLRVFKESVLDWVRIVGRRMKHPRKTEKIKQLKELINGERQCTSKIEGC
jgi:hypothetical protein